MPTHRSLVGTMIVSELMASVKSGNADHKPAEKIEMDFVADPLRWNDSYGKSTLSNSL